MSEPILEVLTNQRLLAIRSLTSSALRGVPEMELRRYLLELVERDMCLSRAAMERDHLASADGFQDAVGEWAESVFTKATDESILCHLRREVGELSESGGDPSEAADCLLLLLHFAHRRGFSLVTEGWRKHEINVARKWGEPDADGVVEHLREVAP